MIIGKRRNLLDIQKELVAKGELITTNIVETKSEHKLGMALLNAGVKIQPQHKVGEYTFDYKILKYPVCIEIDGCIHNDEEQRIKDYRKDRYAQLQGFKVFRFSNTEINTEPIEQFVREVKEMVVNCTIQPREVQLYPLTIREQIKMWFDKIRKKFKRKEE